jgi:hypothetical protein
MAISGPIDKARRNSFGTWPILSCPIPCANTNGAVIFIPYYRRNTTKIFLNPRFFVIGAVNAPTLSISAASAPSFARKQRAQLGIVY